MSITYPGASSGIIGKSMGLAIAEDGSNVPFLIGNGGLPEGAYALGVVKAVDGDSVEIEEA